MLFANLKIKAKFSSRCRSLTSKTALLGFIASLYFPHVSMALEPDNSIGIGLHHTKDGENGYGLNYRHFLDDEFYLQLGYQKFENYEVEYLNNDYQREMGFIDFTLGWRYQFNEEFSSLIEGGYRTNTKELVEVTQNNKLLDKYERGYVLRTGFNLALSQQIDLSAGFQYGNYNEFLEKDQAIFLSFQYKFGSSSYKRINSANTNSAKKQYYFADKKSKINVDIEPAKSLKPVSEPIPALVEQPALTPIISATTHTKDSVADCQSNNHYYLQTDALLNKKRAESAVQTLTASGYEDIQIIEENSLFKVWIGPLDSYQKVQELNQDLTTKFSRGGYIRQGLKCSKTQTN